MLYMNVCYTQIIMVFILYKIKYQIFRYVTLTSDSVLWKICFWNESILALIYLSCTNYNCRIFIAMFEKIGCNCIFVLWSLISLKSFLFFFFFFFFFFFNLLVLIFLNYGGCYWAVVSLLWFFCKFFLFLFFCQSIFFSF